MVLIHQGLKYIASEAKSFALGRGEKDLCFWFPGSEMLNYVKIFRFLCSLRRNCGYLQSDLPSSLFISVKGGKSERKEESMREH